MYLVKVQHAYVNLLLFIHVFIFVLIFYRFPFRQPNAWPVVLPTSDKWQCHPNVGQHVNWT